MVENVRPSMAKADLYQVENGDLTLEQARELSGELVTAVLHDTDSALKAYGDKAQVSRWKKGTENPNLARLLQKADARRAMAKALLRSVGGVRVLVTFEFEEKVG